MFIRTERLFLRPAWPEDLEDIFEALTGDVETRTAVDAGLPRSIKDMRVFLESERSRRLPLFMMYLRAAGGPKMVGCIGLLEIESQVELACWIKTTFAGEGFAGEAMRAVLEQARSLGHDHVFAWQPVDDATDADVLINSGFEDLYQTEERFVASRGAVVPVRRFEARLEHLAAPVVRPQLCAAGLN